MTSLPLKVKKLDVANQTQKGQFSGSKLPENGRNEGWPITNKDTFASRAIIARKIPKNTKHKKNSEIFLQGRDLHK
jgi:hypothetical protein